MREVKIAVHYVRGIEHQFALPIDDIAAVFRSAGVLMTLDPAPPLSTDPNMKTEGYKPVVKSLQDEPMGLGHLYVGIRPPVFFPKAAGQLLDLSRRRAAALFTSSSYIHKNGHRGLLQTAVHELGHILNLAHPSTIALRPSAMSSLSARDVNIEKAWEVEKTDAEKRRKQGRNDQFSMPTRALDCLPFSYSDRLRLHTYVESDLLPGGGPYNGDVAHD